MRLPGLGLLLASLVACSAGDEGEPNSGPTSPPPTNNPPAAPPAAATVAMVSTDDGYGSESHRFNPTRASIARSGTVTWTNGTGLLHNVTFSSANAPASIPNYSTGDRSIQFPNPGTWAYTCTNHPGMNGEVVVAP